MNKELATEIDKNLYSVNSASHIDGPPMAWFTIPGTPDPIRIEYVSIVLRGKSRDQLEAEAIRVINDIAAVRNKIYWRRRPVTLQSEDEFICRMRLQTDPPLPTEDFERIFLMRPVEEV